MIKKYYADIEYCPFCGDHSMTNTAITEIPSSSKLRSIYYNVHCSICGSKWKERTERPDSTTCMEVKQVCRYGDLAKLKPVVALYVIAMRGAREAKGDRL